MEEILGDNVFGLNPILDVPYQHQMYGSDLPWISPAKLPEDSFTDNQTFITITPQNYSSNSPPPPAVVASSSNQLTIILDFSKDSFSYCKETENIIDTELVMEKNGAGKVVRSAQVPRNTWQAQEHVVAERKRREKMGQLFISLSKILPGIKKLDKGSLLEDAIKYTKALQERVRALEEELQGNADNSKPSSSTAIEGGGVSTSPQGINVRIRDRCVLIRIHCKKHEGFVPRIHMEMESMNLSVADLRIIPFGANSFLDITILAQDGFYSTGKDIVSQLEKAFFSQ